MKENLGSYNKTTYLTSKKQLCVLQFSAYEALHVVVKAGQINMTIIIIMKNFNYIEYMIFLMV